MNFNHPLETITITTTAMATHLFNGISDFNRKQRDEYTTFEDISWYLDFLKETYDTDEFYKSLSKGVNQSSGVDYFESDKELNDYISKNNLYLVDECLAVSDEANEIEACVQALEMLNSLREEEKEYE